MRPTHLETRYKHDLSPRQREVLERIARGKTNAEIADELGISLDGAKYHVREILAKLGVESREEAAAEWRRMRSPLGRLRHLVLVGMGGLPKSGPVLAAVGAVVVVAGVIGGLVLLASGGEEDAPASPEGTRTSVPAESPTPRSRSTGIPEIDAVIDAVARGDVTALASAAKIQEIPCSALPASLCPGPTVPGATARILPSAICDDNPIPEGSVRSGLAQFLARVDATAVYAAWFAQPGPDGPPASVPAESVRVMWQSGSSLVISRDGEIWYVWHGCGPASEEFAKIPAEADFLVGPEPVPSPTPGGSVLPPCDTDSARLSLELAPDGENVRVRLSARGAEDCSLNGQGRLRLIAGPGIQPQQLPWHANMDRRFKVAVTVPTIGTLVEWVWGNWCGPRESHQWEVVIGEGRDEARVTAEVDSFPDCVNDTAPTAARVEVIGTGVDGELWPSWDDGQCEGMTHIWAGWSCQFIQSVQVDVTHGQLPAMVAAGMPETVACTGSSEPARSRDLCEGARAGEVRLGYPFMESQTSDVVLLPPAEFVAGLDTGVDPELSVIGFGGVETEPGAMTFLILFGRPQEPDSLYLVFRMARGREPALIAAGRTEVDPEAFFGSDRPGSVELTTVLGTAEVGTVWAPAP